MIRIFPSISVVSILLAFNSFAAEINLTAADGFSLKSDYYQAKNTTTNSNNRAVLMLHQCNYNRTMYDDIGEQLAQRGIHAVSLDFRGFGESTSDEFNVTTLSKLPQEKQGQAWSKMSSHWPSDVKTAYNFLHQKVGKESTIGIIGASCGGSQAITLAEKENISVISFFSSAQRDENITRYEKVLGEKPTLIIAAEDDGRTFTSAQQLFKTAKNPSSKMLSYKGSMHGYPLLDSDKQLTKTIVAWFDNNLVNN